MMPSPAPAVNWRMQGERKVPRVHGQEENRFLAADALSRGPGLWSHWPGELKEFLAANERQYSLSRQIEA